MSETTPYLNPEFGPGPSEAYQRVDVLTSDVVFDQEIQRLQTEQAQDPALQAYAALETEELQATREMYSESRKGNHDLSSQHEATIRETAEKRQSFPSEVKQKHRQISRQLDALTGPYQSRWVEVGDFEADVVTQIIHGAPRPQHADVKRAPMKDYAQNTEEAWKHVPDGEIREYLGERTFFETNQARRESSETRKLVIDTHKEEPLEIPLDLIVNAAGFDSWLGREGHGSGKQVTGKYQQQYDSKIPSLEVIKHYASLPSELPPVGRIDLYIQPNGVIFGDNNEGDSHRIAAAILRGDTTIKANQVSIRCVDQNWLEAAPSPVETEAATSSAEAEQSTGSRTSNGHEITRPREVLEYDELQGMLETYGLKGATAKERVESLRSLSNESMALFMTDLNARLNGSEDPLIHEETMKIGERPTVAPEKRYDLFTNVMQKVKNSPEGINTARVGDALALTTVLLHPFKDGNGRTARMLGFIFRDSDSEAEARDDFATLGEPRDKARERGGFMINGYIPYLGEGVDQSDPKQVEAYIDEVLSNADKNLYTSPYGQAPLLPEK